MNSIKKIAAVTLAAATAAAAFSGCKQLETKEPSETVIATFGDEKIMLDEVLYSVHGLEYIYESFYGSDICSSDLGDGSGKTVGEYIVDTVLTQLRQTKVLNEYAQKNGIALDDDQKQKVTEAVDKLFDEQAEYAEAIGATRELVEKSYTENAVANLVYVDLVADVDTTVGDDEFLRKAISYVKLTPSELTETSASDETSAEVISSEENGSAEEGSEAASVQETEAETVKETASEAAETSASETAAENTSEAVSEQDASEPETLSAEEEARQEAMEAAADEILGRFENSEAAADFIDNYKNESYYTATYSDTKIAEDGTAVYNAAAWALSTDECTIYNSEDGSIYIIRCTNDNDEEARQSAIDTEIENRKSALFSEKYAVIQDESSKFKVDEDVKSKITFAEPVFVAPTAEETEEETGSSEAVEAETEAGTEAETAAETAAEAETETAAEAESETETPSAK